MQGIGTGQATTEGIRVLRFILGILGAIFSFLTIGAFLIALIVGAVFWMYGRDLPNHEQLAQYAPATISRVYSSEGELIDEFARERRLFVPSSEIPDLVKEAFISAEDKNFYIHKGYDPVGMVAAAMSMAQGGSRGARLRAIRCRYDARVGARGLSSRNAAVQRESGRVAAWRACRQAGASRRSAPT